jgi:hypothetical protein
MRGRKGEGEKRRNKIPLPGEPAVGKRLLKRNITIYL